MINGKRRDLLEILSANKTKERNSQDRFSAGNLIRHDTEHRTPRALGEMVVVEEQQFKANESSANTVRFGLEFCSVSSSKFAGKLTKKTSCCK